MTKTEEESFIIEHALNLGAEVLDDDATVFKMTEAQILELVQSRQSKPDIIEHTNWESHPLNVGYVNVKRLIKSDGKILAYVVYEDERVPGISIQGEHVRELNERHALLMAAAPDLLDALEECVANIARDDAGVQFVTKARAAIAKARGK